MGLVEFLDHYKTSDTKHASHTSMTGGKWNIPPKESKRFYKLIRKAVSKGEVIQPLTEKIGELHPLIFDFDLKYSEKIDVSHLPVTFLKSLSEFLWLIIA